MRKQIKPVVPSNNRLSKWRKTYPKRYQNQYARRPKKTISSHCRSKVIDNTIFRWDNNIDSAILEDSDLQEQENKESIGKNMASFLSLKVDLPLIKPKKGKLGIKREYKGQGQKFVRKIIESPEKTPDIINCSVAKEAKASQDEIYAINKHSSNAQDLESAKVEDLVSVCHDRSKINRHQFFQNYKTARRNSVCGGFVRDVLHNTDGNVPDETSSTNKYLSSFLKTISSGENIVDPCKESIDQLKDAQISFHESLVASKASPIPLSIIAQQSERLSHMLLLEGTHIGRARAKPFADWLFSLEPNSIGVLNLTDTAVGAGGLELILEAVLCNHLHSIESLILTGNKINKTSLLHIIRILTWKRLLGCRKSLHSIDMSCCHLNDFLGLQFLRAMINCKHTETLRMRRCNLGKESAIMLAEIITYSNTLKTLDIRDNRISGEGAMAIALALRVNKSLRVIELGYNSFGSSHVCSYNENASESWVCGQENTIDPTEDIHEHGIADFAIVAGRLCEAISTAAKHLKIQEIINCLVGKATLKSVPMQLFNTGIRREDAVCMLPRRVAFFGQGCSHSFKYWMSLFHMLRSQTGNEYIEMFTCACDINRKGIPNDSPDVVSTEQRKFVHKSSRINIYKFF